MKTVKTKIGNNDIKTDWLKIKAADAYYVYEDMCKVLEWASHIESIPDDIFNSIENTTIILEQEFRKL